MDAFTLVARLTLNKQEFETGMAQVEGDLKTDKFTSPFGAWGVTVGNLASQAFTRVFRAGFKFFPVERQSGRISRYRLFRF